MQHGKDVFSDIGVIEGYRFVVLKQKFLDQFAFAIHSNLHGCYKPETRDFSRRAILLPVLLSGYLGF